MRKETRQSDGSASLFTSLTSQCGKEEEGWKGGNAPSLSLRLEESEDVVLSNGTLDVSDDGSRSVVNELDSDLGDSSSGSGSTENLDDTGELDGLLGRLSILLLLNPPNQRRVPNPTPRARVAFDSETEPRSTHSNRSNDPTTTRQKERTVSGRIWMFQRELLGRTILKEARLEDGEATEGGSTKRRGWRADEIKYNIHVLSLPSSSILLGQKLVCLDRLCDLNPHSSGWVLRPLPSLSSLSLLPVPTCPASFHAFLRVQH
jgi:hypothetical protein